MRDREYDRFGPWVIEISEEDPPPPLFVPYLTREEEPLLSVKIPRKIERRKANAGMNLYDYLVSLYGDDMVILQRVGDQVRSYTFPYRDIQYIRRGEELLKGTLHLGLADNDFELNFSTVSSDLIQRLVAQIRERYCAVNQQVMLPGEAAAEDGLSYYFNGMLRKGRVEEPQYQLLAAQATTPLGSHEEGKLSRLIYGVVGKSLLESLHLCDGRELKIITRGRDFNYKWQTVYGKIITYVPIENVIGIRWQGDPRHAAVSHLIIETAAGEISVPFMGENPWIAGYDGFLTAVSEKGGVRQKV